MNKRLILRLFIFLAIVSIQCKKKEIPTVTTRSITDITVSEAKSGGTINSDGDEDIIAKGVCWSTSHEPTIDDSKTIDGDNAQPFASNITGLAPGTVYYLRAYAINENGTGYGQEETFRTLGDAPSATVNPATNITMTSALLSGSVNPNNLTCTVIFEYGTTTSYGKSINAIPASVNGSSSSDVVAAVTGLLPNTTYHFRIKGINAKGEGVSNDISFTTLNEPLITSISNDTVKYCEILSIRGYNFNSVTQVRLGNTTQWIAVTPKSKTNELIEVAIYNHDDRTALLGFNDFKIGLVYQNGVRWTSIVTITSSWKVLANLPGNPRYKAGSFAFPGAIYVGCGAYSGSVLKDFWKYDISTGSWTRMADFPGVPRVYAMGIATSTSGYMGTGHSADNSSRVQLYDFYKYNPSGNSWSAIPDYPDPVNSFFLNYSVSINNRPFVSISDAVPTFREIVNDNWVAHTNQTDLMNAGGNAVFTIGNSLYIVCGYKFASNETNKSVWEYNTVTQVWTKKNDFPGPARNLGFWFTIGNYGYMGCGTTNSPLQYNDMWRYDPSDDSWIRIENFPGGVRSHGISASAGNKGYAGMGVVLGSVSYFKDFWEFNPAME